MLIDPVVQKRGGWLKYSTLSKNIVIYRRAFVKVQLHPGKQRLKDFFVAYYSRLGTSVTLPFPGDSSHY